MSEVMFTTDERHPVILGCRLEPGCYVDGHWGQYGPDQMRNVAHFLGWEPTEYIDDPRNCRRLANLAADRDGRMPEWLYWEYYHGAVERIEQWLNDNTTGGFWTWRDGELFLVPNICETCGRHVGDDSEPCDECGDSDY